METTTTKTLVNAKELLEVAKAARESGVKAQVYAPNGVTFGRAKWYTLDWVNIQENGAAVVSVFGVTGRGDSFTLGAGQSAWVVA